MTMKNNDTELIDIASIKRELEEFVNERDWDKFHTPKNLSMALTIEATELMELFLWLNNEEVAAISPNKLEKIEDEVADILIYLIRIATKLNIDINNAVNKKIEKNRNKYPAELVRGSAKKYTDYD